MNKGGSDISFPSIENSEPSEEGGPIARFGFNYQDEVAIGFLIEMLEKPTLLKVHCETHDDIVLLHENGTSTEQVAEYVQVKASEQDKLWSIPDICQRKKSRVGTSIFETSLGRDKHKEISTFRLVTLRPVVSALKPLTYELTAPGRSPVCEDLKAICAELDKRLPDIVSPKKNDATFWVENCFWDVRHSEEDVRKDNLLRLLRLSTREGRQLLVEPAEIILQELRVMAKHAGDCKWRPDRDKKIILREKLRAWWEQRTYELTKGAALKSGGKLAAKMKDATLPDEIIALAMELRLDYAAEARTPKYLEPEDTKRLQRRVRSEAQSLQSQFFAGQINIDGPGFHALCLDRMDAVNAERCSTTEDRGDFLKGCMYDIADRCLLKFVRQV